MSSPTPLRNFLTASLAALMVFASIERGWWNSTFFIDLELTGQHNLYQLGLNGLLVVAGGLWLGYTQPRARLQAAFRDLAPAYPFVLLALASLFWSDLPVVSAFRLAFLVAAAVFAFYLRANYGYAQRLSFLAGWGLVLIVANLLFIALAPENSIMSNYAYVGNWRGLFWHKNHLGTTLAVVQLILASAVLQPARPRAIQVGLVAAYGLAWLLLLRSQSATGLIASLAAHGGLAVVWLWLRWRTRLHRWHYYGVATLGLIATGLAVGYREPLLALFNRSPSLTGRLPLWQHLIDEYVAAHPWLGHGYGAFWNLAEHRLAVQATVGWPYPVLMGDNGLMDIALHLGLLGVLVYAGFMAVFFVRAGRQLTATPTMVAAFPLLLGGIALLLNTGYSMLFETESLLGVLLWAFLPAREADGPDPSA